MTASDTTRTVLNQLFDLWDRRSEDYDKVLYGVALAEQADAWRIVLAFFVPLPRTATHDPPLTANYQGFSITRGFLTLEQTKEVLTGLVEANALSLPGIPKISASASLHPVSSIRHVTSAENRYPITYPLTQFHFSLDDSCRASPPQPRLYSLNLPLYPRGDLAIEDLLKVKLGGFDAYNGSLFAVAPDYRAKIAELRLSTKGLQVQIESLSETEEKDILGKLYFLTTNGKATHTDLVFNGHMAQFGATEFPHEVILGLMSKTDETLIDERTFQAGIQYTQAGVVVESKEQDIERLVLSGESFQLEFKRELTSKREDFALEAAAFANCEGGRILIGVENKGEIVGCSIPNPMQTIANILRDWCEPSIDFHYEEISVRGRVVSAITIPPGKEKPYIVKDNGIYVRSAGNKRAATRYEVDQMYNEKSVF